MGELINMAIAMDKEVYDYIMERGFMEVCLRRGDKKFSAFMKCVLGRVQPEVAKQLETKMMQNDMLNAKDLRKFARDLGNGMDKILQNISLNAKILGDMSGSMEDILKEVGKVQNLSWLNAGLNIANLGVTAVGFAVMYNKLENISDKIAQLENSLEAIKLIEKQFNIVDKYSDLRADAKIYFSKIANGYVVPHEDIEKLAKKYGIYINSLLDIVSQVDTEMLLSIIYEALPVFNQLIISYYETYYGYYENRHPLHSDWMKTFDRVNGEVFRATLRDYYFLDCGLSNKEVNTIMDGQLVLNCDMIMQINDVLAILDAVGNVDMYRMVKEATDHSVAEMARSYMPTLQDVMGDDEALALLRDSLKESMGMELAVA